MTMITVSCPGCGNPSEFSDIMAGKTVKCWNCEREIDLPVLAKRLGTLARVGETLARVRAAWVALWNKQDRKGKLWLVCIMAVPIFLVLVLANRHEKPHNIKKPHDITDEFPNYGKPIGNITAAELIAAYQRDDFASDREYGESIAEVSGYVGEMKRSPTNYPYLCLKPDRSHHANCVECYFKDDHEVEKAKFAIAIDRAVIIRGQVGGWADGDVALFDCEIAAR
jgi:tRNA_anti-like